MLPGAPGRSGQAGASGAAVGTPRPGATVAGRPQSCLATAGPPYVVLLRVGPSSHSVSTGAPFTLPPVPRSSPSQRVTTGLWIASGLSLFLFALVTVAALTGRSLAASDPALTQWAVSIRQAWSTALLFGFTHAGGTVGLTALTVIVCALLFWRGWREHAYVLGGMMITSSLLTVVLKLIFARERPSTELLLAEPSSSFSFPSGHSLNSAVFAGTLAAFVLCSQAKRWHTWVAVIVTVAFAGVVGFSRLYLAYHWLTDILGGFLLALALLFSGFALLRSRGWMPAVTGARVASDGATPSQA